MWGQGGEVSGISIDTLQRKGLKCQAKVLGLYLVGDREPLRILGRELIPSDLCLERSLVIFGERLARRQSQRQKLPGGFKLILLKLF